MLIYLLIAAELAILYTVFWYVYVRDPKPYKIVGNLWGKYDESGFTAGGADPTLPIAVRNEQEIMQWWHSQSSSNSCQDDAPYGSTHHACKANALHYRRMMYKRFPLRHTAREEAQSESPQEEKFISRVLGMFSRTLDALNVKTP